MSEAMKNDIPEINFEKRAEQILSNEPILAAKDVEVQFKLRGQKLTAIRKCSCLLYTSPSPRDRTRSRMPSSA